MRRLAGLLSIAAVIAAFAAPSPGAAAIFTVDRTDDAPSATACADDVANDCSLRGAIVSANAAADPSTVVVPSGDYALTAVASCHFATSQFGSSNINTKALCIEKAMTIAGAGAATTHVSGGDTGQLFMVGNVAPVAISGLRLEHGRFDDRVLYGQGGAINNAGALTIDACILRDNVSAGSGGAIYNSNALVVRRSTFDGNTADAYGGAIFDFSDTLPTTVHVVESTLSHNSAGLGGGGLMNFGGTMTVTGSTIDHNDGGSYGGGIWNSTGSLVVVNSTISGNRNFHSYGGGIYNADKAELRSVTITDNHAGDGGAGGLGGGIAHLGTQLELGNSIIAGNTATYFVPADAGPDCYSNTITSLGFNLIGVLDAQCPLAGDTTGNLANQDAQLGALAENGGTTSTHALLPGSPAIDAGNPAAPGSGGDACPAFDQRGFQRPVGAHCDIGAVELLPGFAVYGIVPARSGNTATVLVHVAGNGFEDGVSVRLRRTGQTDIVGTPLSIDAGGSGISTLFDLDGATLGAWDLVVANPSATSTTPGAFEVETTAAPDLWVSVVGPRGIRIGRPTRFLIAYGNRGNVDALAVPLTLSFGAGVEFRPLFSLAVPPPQAGQLAVDWSLQSLEVDVGANGATNVPLLLPIVPAGFCGTLEITLTLPPTTSHGAEFTSLAALGEPLLTPLPNPAAIATSVEGARAYADANFDYTLPETLTPALTAYAQAQLAAIVADGRTQLIENIGSDVQVSSLTWLQLDLALFGTGQVLEQSPLLMSALARLATDVRSVPALLGPADAVAAICPVTPCKGSVLAPGCGCTDIQCDSSSRNGTAIGSGCYPPPIPAPPNCQLAGKQTVSEFLENLKKCRMTKEHCEALPGHKVVTTADGSAFCVPNDQSKHCPSISIPNPIGAGSLDCIGTPITLSADPNDKTGVVGAGNGHAIVPGTPLPYTIRFENDPAHANAPAQVVTITDQLDLAKVDVATFSLGPISFGSIQVPMPPGAQQYTGGVDLRPEQNLLVLIAAGVDLQTGIVMWELTSVDPETQQITTNPEAGFLPPNVTAPEGEGLVSFTVMPKPDLPDDAAICNQASIVFDVHPAILTPQWCNGIDRTAPSSAVAPLPLTTTSPTFALTWSGSDGGTGIADYTIYVSTDDGPFMPLLSSTEDTATQFQGQAGSSYAFYSVARDLVGNQEAPPSTVDTRTTVLGTAGASDLAVIKLSVPKSVTLSATKPRVTKKITVQLQNRGAHAETIPDVATAANLVHVDAVSLGACAAPIVTLNASAIKKPLVIKSKKKAALAFDVTFECANFPGKSTKSSPGLEDYRFTATVTRAALGGGADAHVDDDVCPRQVAPPSIVDPFPDGTIRDKGCGTKRPDKTFGGPVLTDVLVKSPR